MPKLQSKAHTIVREEYRPFQGFANVQSKALVFRHIAAQLSTVDMVGETFR